MKYYNEPYKSCSLLGALRYFSGIEDVVCLIHGPYGCSFFVRNSVFDLNGYNRSWKFRPKIFTTGMNEDDAIFGGRKKIIQAVREIIKDLDPKYIVVFNCCLSELTGESIESICEEIGDSECKIICIHSAGFKGDHIYGYRLASDIYFKNFCMFPALKQDRSVNLLGEFNINHLSTLELKRYLSEADISIIAELPVAGRLYDVQQSSAAELNVVYCGNASLRLAKLFKEKYDIPYVGGWGACFGCEGSKNFYDSIFDFFHADKNIYLKDYENLKNKIGSVNKKLSGKKAFIIAGMRRGLGYAKLFKELEIEVKYIYSEMPNDVDVSCELEQSAEIVIYNQGAEDLRELIEIENPDFILTTLNELIAPYRFLSIPPEDYIGFEGMINFIDVLLDVINDGNSVYLEQL